MREEIAAAVVFITRLVKKNEKLSKEQIQTFSSKLSEILVSRFKNHWYQDKPMKGQAYRCIRINEAKPADPVLLQAAEDSGIPYTDLNLPPELTVWVDPNEVCCRFGELKGSYCTVASFNNGKANLTAHSMDIDNVVQESQVKKEAELTKITRSKLAQQNVNNNHNLNNNGTPSGKMSSKNGSPAVNYKKNGSPAPKTNNQRLSSPPKKSPHKLNHFAPSFHPSDRFHWVRGADLVKA